MFRKMAWWIFLGAALALLAAPAARADYEAGRKAWGAGRHAEAVAEWRGAAAGGDARAMLALGRAYLRGLGVPQDYVLAHMWFNLSASRGKTRAAKERDALSARMTPGQIASAQDRARSWRPGGQAAAPPAAPSSPAPAGPPPKRALAEAQGLLNALGYEAGAPDGVWGPRSIRAYGAFLRDSGLPPAESLTPDTLRAMRKAARGKPASKPARRTPEPTADLHRIVKAGDIDGLKKALAGKNAKVNARDARGLTPLMHAVDKGYTVLVPPLLKAGADPNIRLADGATALFMAAVHGQAEIFGRLLEAGADPKVKGPRGTTSLEIAGKHPDIAALPRVVALLREEALAAGPKCAEYDDTECWIRLADKPECHVWKDVPVNSMIRHDHSSKSLTWSGSCANGMAAGKGTLTVSRNYTHKGKFVEGKKQGQWVETLRVPRYTRTDKGAYTNGKRHGHWKHDFANGATIWRGPYVNGKAHGEWRRRNNDGSWERGPFVDGHKHGFWREKGMGVLGQTCKTFDRGKYVSIVDC